MTSSIGMTTRAAPRKERIVGNNDRILEPCDFSAIIQKANRTDIKLGFDFSIVDPFAKSFSRLDFAEIVKRREAEKIQKYDQYCKENHVNFSPIVFSALGMASDNAVSKIKDLLKKRPDMGSLVIQKINLVILKYGGRAVMKYYGLDKHLSLIHI